MGIITHSNRTSNTLSTDNQKTTSKLTIINTMAHAFTFENMMSKYPAYIADKYKDTWGLNEDFKNEREEYQNGGLCFLKQHFGKWLNKHLYSQCVEAGFDVVSEIQEHEGGYMVSRFNHTSPMEDGVVAPFVLDGWCGENYIIKLDGRDDTGLFMLLLGQMLHEYGVASERHRERGLVDPNQRDLMFRAMLVENVIGELYRVVESAV